MVIMLAEIDFPSGDEGARAPSQGEPHDKWLLVV